MTETDATVERRRGARLVQPDEWRPADIDDLEPAAWAALRDPGCTAVAAGPGAGKTEFLAQQAAYLLQTGTCPAPQRILAISYKRDSAANLARRVARRVPEHAHRFVSLTFDAFTKSLVDRFASALPVPWALNGRQYEIAFYRDSDARNFLTTLASATPAPLGAEIYTVGANTFLSGVLGTWPLPSDPMVAPKDPAAFAAWSWWNDHYVTTTAPRVDFTMLNRLADLLVRCTPQLRRALRATYPFVFVDEFQDTTGAQFTFLNNAFGPPGVVTTAVGDSKQQIMRWAGALEDALNRYQLDFAARRHELIWNFRSSAALVDVQHHVASRLEPGTARALSRAATEDDHVPVAIWTFKGEADQAQRLADWIAADIATSTRTPADFAFIAKQKVADLEPELDAALAQHGIGVRNDDAIYGTMRLQDLLKHDVTRLVLGVLRLAARDRGLAGIWTETRALLGAVCSGDRDEVASRALSDHLGQFTAELRAWLATNPPAAGDSASLVNRAASIVPPAQLARLVRSERGGEDAAAVLASLTQRIAAVTGPSGDWVKVFADVSGQDAVTLMTIHRSKGLEYHTVFVLDLDDDQWWSYRNQARETTSTFFVGLSRAAQRLIFTCTTPSARRSGIQDLYDLLEEAGVSETHW